MLGNQIGKLVSGVSNRVAKLLACNVQCYRVAKLLACNVQCYRVAKLLACNVQCYRVAKLLACNVQCYRVAKLLACNVLVTSDIVCQARVTGGGDESWNAVCPLERPYNSSVVGGRYLTVQ